MQQRTRRCTWPQDLLRFPSRAAGQEKIRVLSLLWRSRKHGWAAPRSVLRPVNPTCPSLFCLCSVPLLLPFFGSEPVDMGVHRFGLPSFRVCLTWKTRKCVPGLSGHRVSEEEKKRSENGEGETDGDRGALSLPEAWGQHGDSGPGFLQRSSDSLLARSGSRGSVLQGTPWSHPEDELQPQTPHQGLWGGRCPDSVSQAPSAHLLPSPHGLKLRTHLSDFLGPIQGTCEGFSENKFGQAQNTNKHEFSSNLELW
ncbi:uncharacterized protein LOC104873633 [Fukomys damarensis]|uniref:uncharacterized protein LOC104873633 n=1 Tax=Fukomys damarensis TaxID=885580 RepID=UPI00053F777C|nr:uncharacterized protein LOC104873633 [Fukomys damarensis]XP_010638730.1 uncharacterized protein LOC104873633 [Fukomys damarensis]XP_019065526.1 uncharacterized protein LOC104873633 [Fukomys damarensis]